MRWFVAWVAFSCIVVPALSWACARLREARRTVQPRLERADAGARHVDVRANAHSRRQPHYGDPVQSPQVRPSRLRTI
jgi:hypothetical protein